jgi:hypothetical protein
VEIPKKFKTVTTLSKTVALILFISLPFIGFYVGSNYKKTISSLYSPCVNNVSDKSVSPKPDEKGLITFRGIIRKDKIPAELQLGDYSMMIYFDEPYLLEDNAFGKPVYINSMQVYDPVDGRAKLNDFVSKHVEIFGTLTWGYAESRVIQAVSITEL